MEADKWLTLQDDLLVDIFRRLEITAVIRSAATCRTWRRAIIDNGWSFRPRRDRFLPDLLLGFLDKHLSRLPRRLEYVPASNTAVPTLFTPETGVGVVVDGWLYNNLLSSRDGFLLLREEKGNHESLCLCNALTGTCKMLPAAPLFDGILLGSMYVLATGYDVDADNGGGDDAAVWILAVDRIRDSKDGMLYQIFSSRSGAAGAWGPVRCSTKFPDDVAHAFTDPSSSMGSRGTMVVCHGAVSWLVRLLPAHNRTKRMCMFTLDLRTERTWTTELPDFSIEKNSCVLAVEDSRVSLVKMLKMKSGDDEHPPHLHLMEVWVLVGDDQWTLRRTIDIDDVPSMRYLCLSGFCPRSGYLFGTGIDDLGFEHPFLIGVDGSSPRLIGSVESRSSASWIPYEMDWSTYISSYISKMKYF